MYRKLIPKIMAKVAVRRMRRSLLRDRRGVGGPTPGVESDAAGSGSPSPSTNGQRLERDVDPDGVTILVAADEEAVREILEVRFKREGFNVRTAKDGNEAVKRIRTSPPDLVFLDWLMPYKNGMRVLKEIRRSDDLSDLPVFMMLDRGNSADMAKALSAGANDCIEKPINFDLTLARIRTQLDLIEQHERIRSLVQYDTETRLFNRTFLMERLDVELERVQRHGGVLTVMVIELRSNTDAFPEDSLRVVADHFRDTLRQMDVLGRLDRDHFGVILPETSEEENTVVLKRIKQSLRRENLTEYFSFSFGSASTEIGEVKPGEMVEAALENVTPYEKDRIQQTG